MGTVRIREVKQLPRSLLGTGGRAGICTQGLRGTWLSVSAGPQGGCVTRGKRLPFSDPRVLSGKVGTVTPATWAFGRIQHETVWKGCSTEANKCWRVIPTPARPVSGGSWVLSIPEEPGVCLAPAGTWGKLRHVGLWRFLPLVALSVRCPSLWP